MKRIFQCCKQDDRLEVLDHASEPPPPVSDPRLSSMSTLVVSHETNKESHYENGLSFSPPRDISINSRGGSFTDDFTRSESGYSLASSLDGMSLMRIGEIFENGMKVSDHKYHFRNYPNCFVAREAVDFLVKNKLADSRKHAVQIGNALMKEYNLMEHVCRQHSFKDEYLFFQFVPKHHRFVSIQDEVGCFMHTYGHALLDDDSEEGSLGSLSLNSASSFQDLSELAKAFENEIETKDLRYHFQTYNNVFIGSDAVDYMVISGMARSRHHAVELGRALTREYNLFRHVLNQHEFRDDYLFYSFTPQDERFAHSDADHNDTSHAEQHDKSCPPLQEAAFVFENEMPIKDHMYRLKVYKKTFVGSKAVDFMIKSKLAETRKDAVRLGRKLVHQYNLFEHVCNEHDFQDDYFFYRFVPPERRITPDDEDSQHDVLLPDAYSDHSHVSSVGNSGNTPSLLQVANAFRKGVHVGTHVWRFKSYRNTFVASQAVDFLVNSSFAQTRREAVVLGRRLASEMHLFEHVTGDHSFKDDYLFFKFTSEKEKARRKESFASDMTSESDSLHLIAQSLRANVRVADNKYRMRTYKDTFIGREAVDLLVEEGLAENREHAVELGRQMATSFNLFEHCVRQHEFKDAYLFYRFVNMGELKPRVTRDDITDDTVVDLRELNEIAIEFEKGVKTSENRHHLRVYKDTFVGSDAVDFLVSRDASLSREDAVHVGQLLARAFNLFEHVSRQHPLKDEHLFYRFNPKSERYTYDLEKLAKFEETPVDTIGETTVSSTNDKDDGFSFSTKVERSQSFSMPAKSASTGDVKSFSAGSLDIHRRASVPVRPAAALRKADRVKIWSTTFRRVDPRYQILSAVNIVTQEKAYSLQDGIDRDVISDLLRGTDLAPMVFSIWRPTSFDAIRRMMLNEGTGKGLDIKGKSAKRGKLSGFVPFLQINENRHKYKVRTLPKDGRVRLFFKNKRAREVAAAKLEAVGQDMIETVRQASKILSNDRASESSQRDALKSMLLDVTDPSIIYIDDYSPQSYGMDLSVRVFWEACFVRQDCTRRAGSEFDTGRPSLPPFQDMNFASLRNRSTRNVKGMPKAVVLQYGTDDPLSPFEFVMAYEENGRVLPVVSDFDCFLIGTRNVRYSAPLPPDQLEVLTWCVDKIEEILESPPRPHSWTSRWLEVLRDSANDGFHPKVPQLGFGDPVSYSTMENTIHRLTSTAGPVRHGAECFNYYFPQDLDDEYLVISDTVPGNVCWKYLNVDELQDFLSEKIDGGYTFPLNPKNVLCDGGRWKELYDKLIASRMPHVQESMNVWYPENSGLRKQIEAIHSKHPEGFQRESLAEDSSRFCLEKNQPKDASFKITMESTNTILDVAA